MNSMDPMGFDLTNQSLMNAVNPDVNQIFDSLAPSTGMDLASDRGSMNVNPLSEPNTSINSLDPQGKANTMAEMETYAALGLAAPAALAGRGALGLMADNPVTTSALGHLGVLGLLGYPNQENPQVQTQKDTVSYPVDILNTTPAIERDAPALNLPQVTVQASEDPELAMTPSEAPAVVNAPAEVVTSPGEPASTQGAQGGTPAAPGGMPGVPGAPDVNTSTQMQSPNAAPGTPGGMPGWMAGAQANPVQEAFAPGVESMAPTAPVGFAPSVISTPQESTFTAAPPAAGVGPSGIPTGTPSSATMGALNGRGTVAQARDFLVQTANPGSTMQKQGVETAIGRLAPEFAVKLSGAIAEARSKGINVSVHSAFRSPDMGANPSFATRSLHGTGGAVDVSGIGKAGSVTAKTFHQIAAKHGVFGPYGPNNGKEFNHFQAVPGKVAPGLNPRGVPSDISQAWARIGLGKIGEEAEAKTNVMEKAGPGYQTGRGQQGGQQGRSTVNGKTFTFYAPGTTGKGRGLEGRFIGSKGNPLSTMDDLRSGKSGVVSLSGHPSQFGKTVPVGTVNYKSPLDGKNYTVHNVMGRVDDTGGKFGDKGNPGRNHFDIAVGDFRGKSGGSEFVGKNSVSAPSTRYGFAPDDGHRGEEGARGPTEAPAKAPDRAVPPNPTAFVPGRYTNEQQFDLNIGKAAPGLQRGLNAEQVAQAKNAQFTKGEKDALIKGEKSMLDIITSRAAKDHPNVPMFILAPMVKSHLESNYPGGLKGLEQTMSQKDFTSPTPSGIQSELARPGAEAYNEPAEPSTAQLGISTVLAPTVDPGRDTFDSRFGEWGGKGNFLGVNFDARFGPSGLTQDDFNARFGEWGTPGAMTDPGAAPGKGDPAVENAGRVAADNPGLVQDVIQAERGAVIDLANNMGIDIATAAMLLLQLKGDSDPLLKRVIAESQQPNYRKMGRVTPEGYEAFMSSGPYSENIEDRRAEAN